MQCNACMFSAIYIYMYIYSCIYIVVYIYIHIQWVNISNLCFTSDMFFDASPAWFFRPLGSCWAHVGPRPPGKFGSVSPSHMELLPDAEKGGCHGETQLDVILKTPDNCLEYDPKW